MVVSSGTTEEEQAVDEQDYLAHDGLGLAELVASGEAKPGDLLAAARSRADAVNPRINAICTRLDEHADARVTERLDGPFAGVPFLLKDLHQQLAGEPTSDGCRALAGTRAERTGTVVQRWLDAGLVVFGKTNTPEFGSKGVTEPALFGPTRNPWALDRTPGGSSGGSAAAVAAGIVPVAGASDGGGSIRIPAACTGLVGLKPGRGLVPSGPDDSEPLGGLATQGVISRTVRDSAAMLDLLAGPDDMSPYTPAVPERPLLSQLDEPTGPLRIGYTAASSLRDDVHPEAVRAVEHAAQLLTELGHHVEEVEPPYDDRQLGEDFLTVWFVHQADELARIKRDTDAGDDHFEQDTRMMAELGRGFSAVELQAAQERRRDHVAALARFHTGHDLLLTPTLGEPPIRTGSLTMPAPMQWLAEAMMRTKSFGVLRRTGIVDQVVRRNLGWVPYTQLANMTGRPAISLPLHLTPDGLPLGVQFVGRLSSEALLLRLARALEVAAPWDRHLPRTV